MLKSSRFRSWNSKGLFPFLPKLLFAYMCSQQARLWLQRERTYLFCSSFVSVPPFAILLKGSLVSFKPPRQTLIYGLSFVCICHCLRRCLNPCKRYYYHAWFIVVYYDLLYWLYWLYCLYTPRTIQQKQPYCSNCSNCSNRNLGLGRNVSTSLYQLTNKQTYWTWQCASAVPEGCQQATGTIQKRGRLRS